MAQGERRIQTCSWLYLTEQVRTREAITGQSVRCTLGAPCSGTVDAGCAGTVDAGCAGTVDAGCAGTVDAGCAGTDDDGLGLGRTQTGMGDPSPCHCRQWMGAAVPISSGSRRSLAWFCITAPPQSPE